MGIPSTEGTYSEDYRSLTEACSGGEMVSPEANGRRHQKQIRVTDNLQLGGR